MTEDKEKPKRGSKKILVAGVIIMAISAVGLLNSFDIIDVNPNGTTIMDLVANLPTGFVGETNKSKQISFLENADCSSLEFYIEEGKKEQKRIFTHYQSERIDGQSESKSISFSIDNELVPKAEKIYKNKCEIYAFEYENDLYDESREIIDRDLKLTFYDMELNPLNIEYWYSNCLDMDCKETTPNTSRDTVIVPIESDFVKFTIQTNSTMFLDANEIVDRNSNIISFDYLTIDKFGEFVFTMDTSSLRGYYQTQTELLPMTYLFLSGFQEEPIKIPVPQVRDHSNPVLDELLEDVEITELTNEEKALKLPKSLSEMTKFVSNYPDLTEDEIQILMSYAVTQERGIPNDIVDAEARKIVLKLQ